MPVLRLILGPPGSGKTHLVLSEVAQALLGASKEGPGALEGPRLLLLSPEQQALQLERGALGMLGDLGGRPSVAAESGAPGRAPSARWPAASRLRVLSFSRLARLLEAESGSPFRPGDLGRSLLCWRVLRGKPALLKLADGPRAAPVDVLAAQAAPVLADLAAELELHATSAEELREAAAAGLSDAALAERLGRLADFLDAYQLEALRLGTDFTPAPARIPGLLQPGRWPLEAPGLRVWVDGFASFTPAEESALLALLGSADCLSATLLLDPQRRAGPLESDVYDWYAPTREQLRRWEALAGKAGARLEYVQLATPQRWPAGSALSLLATSGPQPCAAPAMPADAKAAVRACRHADVAAEADWAARELLALARGERGAPLRFGEMSLVCRSLELYRAPLELALREHSVPYFLDQRHSLSQHPALELLRSGLRLALGEADADDPYALLACGLLPAPEGQPADEAAWQLSAYGRGLELKPWHWLEAPAWRRWRRLTRREGDPEQRGQLDAESAARLAELDAWRRAMFAPVARLREELRGLETRSVGSVLRLAWEQLLGEGTQAVLADWAGAAGAEAAALHSGVIPALAGLFDEFDALAGDMPVELYSRSGDDLGALSPALLCRWLEAGLSQLSLGFAPPGLDQVLVTGIERGRHGQVRASLLLGLAAGVWPPSAGEGALLDSEMRARLNTWAAQREPGRRLLGGGAREDSAREAYFALVAVTRPSEQLILSRPGADNRGRELLPSPWYSGLCAALGLAEEPQARSAGADTAAALVRQSALWPQDQPLRALAQRLGETGGPAARAAWAGLGWTAAQASLRTHPPLPEAALAALYGAPGAREYRGSVTRLETFAACPFKHFARADLKLSEERPARGGQSLGLLYHALLEHAVRAATRRGLDWRAPDPAVLEAALGEALAQTGQAALEESGRAAMEYLLERSALVLDYLLAALAEGLSAQGRAPLLNEAGFGQPGAPLPALTVDCPQGRIRLSGYIDRIDAGPEGAAVTDYKTHDAEFRWSRFLAGEQLQLPAYLLAIAGQAPGGGPPLLPRGMALQRIEPHFRSGSPEAGFSATEPLVPGARAKFDSAGLAERTLAEARRVIAELGGRILDGEYLPRPARQGQERACAHCAFRPVCRFDPQVHPDYRDLRGSDARLRDAIAAGLDLSGSARPGWEAPQ